VKQAKKNENPQRKERHENETALTTAEQAQTEKRAFEATKHSLDKIANNKIYTETNIYSVDFKQ